MDWGQVDWSKDNREIAKDLGVAVQAVAMKRSRLRRAGRPVLPDPCGRGSRRHRDVRGWLRDAPWLTCTDTEIAEDSGLLVAVVARTRDVVRQDGGEWPEAPRETDALVGEHVRIRDDHAFAEPEQERLVAARELTEVLDDLLRTLTPRQEAVLRYRFGLGGMEALQLSEVGTVLEVSRERIRQIEAKALQMLRHPDRSKWIKSFVEGGRMSVPPGYVPSNHDGEDERRRMLVEEAFAWRDRRDRRRCARPPTVRGEDPPSPPAVPGPVRVLPTGETVLQSPEGAWITGHYFTEDDEKPWLH